MQDILVSKYGLDPSFNVNLWDFSPGLINHTIQVVFQVHSIKKWGMSYAEKINI